MTLQSGSTQATRGEKVDAERRKVVKLIVAAGAGVITSPWVFQTARSANAAIGALGLWRPAAYAKAVRRSACAASHSRLAFLEQPLLRPFGPKFIRGL